MTGIVCALAGSAGGLSVSVDNASPYGSVSGDTICTTDPATVTAVGGSGSLSYSWARISGDASINADSASSASTTFSRASMPAVTSYAATFRCTVTRGAHSVTVDVVVTCERLS